MNDVYALEPDGFSSFAEVKLALSHFYPYKGRFIVDVPKGWVDKVSDAIDGLTEIEKKRILLMLEKAKGNGCLIAPNFQGYSPVKSWRENIIDLNRTEDLAAALLWDELQCDGQMFRYILDDLPDSSSAPVPMRVADYMKILAPILKSSREVFIVDPYLNPLLERYGVFVDALFDLASKIGRTNFVFISQYTGRIEASDIQGVRERLDDSRRRARGQYRVHCEFHHWTKDILSQHGRYFFSIRCGLLFDRGFEVSLKSSKLNVMDGVNPVSVLGHALHDFLLKTYLDAKASYQAEGIVLR